MLFTCRYSDRFRHCRAIISRFTASVQPLEAKKIETEIDKLKDLQDSLQKAAGKTNSAELKALQKAVFDLATELSKKAVQRTPQIVVSGK